MAAVLAAGTDAVLSHASAAAAWDLRPVGAGAIHVSVPGDPGRARRSGIRLHRSITLEPHETTSPSRDPDHHAGPHHHRPRRDSQGPPARARARPRRATQASSTSPSSTRPSRPTRPGRDHPPYKRCCPATPPGRRSRRSELEERFIALCDRHGLPRPNVNTRIEGVEVDFAWRDARLIVEVDGYAYHRSPRAFEDDRARDVALTVAGWTVLRFTWAQVTAAPAWVAAAIRRRLATSRRMRRELARECGQHDRGRGRPPVPSESVPLSAFTPQVREWFERAFAEPTPAQAQAWPAIATGEHTLISAPTGSGKTLAAFLWALDRLVAEPTADRTRLVYVSPLKALSYDVEKNLRAPLRGIGADVKVGLRTGDTPQKDRRDMVRHPPDILITTPESLYLMLTSQAAKIFDGTEQVIVDEIHAVAQTKRGAHLALTLERLAEAAGRDVQRIGLSATQNPLEEVGRFLVGPKRTCTVVDTGVRKPLDLQVHVPVESMVEPDADIELDPFEGTGMEATRKSIWPAIYPKLLDLVKEHRVDADLRQQPPRRRAARAAPQRAGRRSRSRAPTTARWRARSGSWSRTCSRPASCRAWWRPRASSWASTWARSTSCSRSSRRSRSPPACSGSAAPATTSATSRKGRIFPKFRADLLECAVVAQRMREGQIETTVVPRNPLDVLAQQIVAMAAVGRGRPERRRPATRSSPAPTPTASCRASSSRTCSTCSTAATRRRSSASCARASCGTAWPARSARAAAPAGWRSPTPARSPTAGCTRSTCPTAAASASSTRRWSTRRGPGRPSCSAPRAGGSRRSRATA